MARSGYLVSFPCTFQVPEEPWGAVLTLKKAVWEGTRLLGPAMLNLSLNGQTLLSNDGGPAHGHHDIVCHTGVVFNGKDNIVGNTEL